MKNQNGKNNSNWKGGIPKCKDCGKQLSSYLAKRCQPCSKNEEWRTKIGDTQRGKPKPWLKGSVPWNKGRIGVYSEEQLGRLRRAKAGENNPNFGKPLTETHKMKVSNGLKKYIESNPESRKKFIEKANGETNPNWKGGVTPKYRIIRGSAKYREWRTAVFERDSYTCVICGNNKSGELNADHILPFALFPELRFDINNGRTLCVPCHQKTKSYLNPKISTPEFLNI